MNELLKIIVSLLPVVALLASLIFLDSYKLLRPTAVVSAILAGSAAALICLVINTRLDDFLGLSLTAYSRYVGPLVEEIFKAAPVIFCLKKKKAGFLVDAAIIGFSVGTGFALIENVYYLQTLDSFNPLVWGVRGFGTAVMHGGTTAILSIVSKFLSDEKDSTKLQYFLPGLGLAFFIHSAFNHFLFPPLLMTLVTVITIPILMLAVFERSEKLTRDWLNQGIDSDMELIDTINRGNIGETKIGKYLQALTGRFSGTIVADMLCYLRLRAELALYAKGYMLLRNQGLNQAFDPATRAKFDELKYLEKSIGLTGKLALMPLMRTGSRELWQLYMLERNL